MEGFEGGTSYGRGVIMHSLTQLLTQPINQSITHSPGEIFLLLFVVMAEELFPVGGIRLFHVLLDDLRLGLLFLVLRRVSRHFEGLGRGGKEGEEGERRGRERKERKERKERGGGGGRSGGKEGEAERKGK